MSDTISFMSPGRPGRLHSNVHLWAISRRYQRRIVSGVTMVATCLRTRRQSMALRREAAALVVSQPDAPPLQLILKDTVLLNQVLDQVLVVAIDPSSQGHEQKPQGQKIGRYRPILPCLRWAHGVSSGRAEYRTLRDPAERHRRPLTETAGAGGRVRTRCGSARCRRHRRGTSGGRTVRVGSRECRPRCGCACCRRR